MTTSQTPTVTRADGLTITPLTPAMAEEWSRLYRVIADDDGSTWKPTPTELTEELEPSPRFDPGRQTWSVWSGTEMVAFALAGVRSEPTFDGLNAAYMLGGVHPQWRGRGLGSELLDTAEARGAELAVGWLPDLPVVYRADTTDTAPAASELLRERGYEHARYWFDMTHDLGGTFNEDERAVAFTSDLHEAVRLAHNDAFSTHWGSGPVEADQWNRYMGAAGLRPDLSRLIVDDGEVLAYAIVSSAVPGEAYFDLIGVRGTAQGRGYGRAVLTSALAAIQADGSFTEAGLDVDADNPSGAGRLYSSTGFTNVAKKITWERRP